MIFGFFDSQLIFKADRSFATNLSVSSLFVVDRCFFFLRGEKKEESNTIKYLSSAYSDLTLFLAMMEINSKTSRDPRRGERERGKGRGGVKIEISIFVLKREIVQTKTGVAGISHRDVFLGACFSEDALKSFR